MAFHHIDFASLSGPIIRSIDRRLMGKGGSAGRPLIGIARPVPAEIVNKY
jgi:hypothetical protein